MSLCLAFDLRGGQRVVVIVFLGGEIVDVDGDGGLVRVGTSGARGWLSSLRHAAIPHFFIGNSSIN